MNIVIVEDEYMVAKRLRRFVDNAFSNSKIHIQVFHSIDDANDYLAENIIDGLFLDLNLQGEDGFDLLKQHLSQSFHTVIVSANTDRAIDAFDIGVLDFVAKPFTQERIQKAVDRMQQNIGEGRSKYIAYKHLGRIELLPIKNIHYIKACGHYCEIFTREHTTILHDKNMDKLLAVLPNTYERIHRSYALPLDSITSIHSEEGSKYWVNLLDGEKLPVGRTRYKALKARLNY
ncbi:LytR/AlgR family response regulator transcription factor [Agarilytica rhodophyticola]|uniref:LytR/AlgR family response regulator transcription factor n=1 Tax=Agarilytica rhodophyticola TaxID=1737490 RepID=UPI000B342A93|nr:LytTR family DNA-binding domain-containing protein [Agarilytica rhodophyticola]